MLRPYQNYHREFQKPQRDKKKAAAYLAAFGVLFATTDDLLTSHTSLLVNGTLTPNQWGASVLATLQHSHAVAYSQGAQSLGGDVTPADAQILLVPTMQVQAEFLSGFVDDLEDGDTRYRKTLDELYPEIGTNAEIEARIKAGELVEPHPIGGEDEYWNEKSILSRLHLYNERIRGSGNWGAVDMLEVSEPIKWKLDPTITNHCDTCIERSKVIWFKGTIPGVPGDGSTDCGVNDRCTLETEDGTVIQF